MVPLLAQTKKFYFSCSCRFCCTFCCTFQKLARNFQYTKVCRKNYFSIGSCSPRQPESNGTTHSPNLKSQIFTYIFHLHFPMHFLYILLYIFLCISETCPKFSVHKSCSEKLFLDRTVLSSSGRVDRYHSWPNLKKSVRGGLKNFKKIISGKFGIVRFVSVS